MKRVFLFVFACCCRRFGHEGGNKFVFFPPSPLRAGSFEEWKITLFFLLVGRVWDDGNSIREGEREKIKNLGRSH